MSFSLIVHAGRNEISSEIKIWIIAFIWAIIYSVYSIWTTGPCPQGMRKEPDFFLSQFRHAKLNETISSTSFMLLMMHLFMLLTTLSEISLYITICFKWSKTFEYICTLLRKYKALSHHNITLFLFHANVTCQTSKGKGRKMKLVTLESAYLNYAKNSSCRLLCMNALLIHHIVFSTVSTVIKILVRN